MWGEGGLWGREGMKEGGGVVGLGKGGLGGKGEG